MDAALLDVEPLLSAPERARSVLDRWRARGLGLAVVAPPERDDALRRERIGERADVVVHAAAAAGEPLLRAAESLGVEPARTVIIFGAGPWIEAGATGGFGQVVGLDPAGDGASLRAAGAHRVVRRLSELDDLVPPGTRRPCDLPSALARTADLRARNLAVFLDYDGTLSPIVDDPDAALLPPRTREAVRRLASRFPVAVVSGRGTPDVHARLGLEGLWVAGSHGFDIRAPDGTRHVQPDGEAALPALDRAEQALRARLAGTPGVIVERKAFAIAVHYRRATAEAARDAVRTGVEVAGALPRLRAEHGKKIVELRPDVDWHKGRALRWLVLAMGLRDVTPLYVGDDRTDEDAFAEIAGDGVGVLVGTPRRPTHAVLGLRDPDEVRAFLAQLAGDVPG